MGYINRHKVFFAVQRQVYPANFQEKTITPNTFQREITPDAGYDALSKVKLNGILVDAHTEIESQTDTDIKYQKTVPAGALRYAGLNKLGGMSYKFNQLVQNGNFVDSSVWSMVNCSANYNNNIATLTMTNNIAITSSIQFFQYVSANTTHKYLISCYVKPSVNCEILARIGELANVPYKDCVANTWTNISGIKQADQTNMEVNIYSTDSNLIIGSTIQVKNVMLIDLTDIYGAGNEPTTVAEFKARFNKDYYDYTLPTLHHSPVTEILSNETLNIPAQVQLLNGYGMGVNSTVYNYIDFETKKFKAYALLVDLGTLDWTYSNIAGARYGFVADLSNLKYASSGIPNILSAKYSSKSLSSLLSSEEAGVTTATNDNDIIIFDANYTDALTFKSAMSGEYLVFELATPVETDISEYITQDTLDVIDTITFENEYEQAVPSEINYLIEV